MLTGYSARLKFNSERQILMLKSKIQLDMSISEPILHQFELLRCSESINTLQITEKCVGIGFEKNFTVKRLQAYF